MTQEEKAKAYDKVSKEVKDFFEGRQKMYSDVEQTLKYLFPELCESEDEKVEKAIFGMVYDSDNELWSSYDVSKSDVLAWLEKQGEQKSIDDLTPQETMDIAVAKCFDEQKPKVGDWVVNNISKDVFLIKSINNGYCTLEDIKGNIISPCLPPCESESHLWTIQDAKDGDILAVERDKTPFIFKGFDRFHPECPVAYCGIDEDGIFIVSSGEGWWTDEKVYPATKEQRELLFSKMKGYGYEWNEKEKRLIKVPKTKEETGVLKQLIDEEKSVWSEEDESYLNTTIAYLKDAKEFKKTAENCINWLKSIKRRIGG